MRTNPIEMKKYLFIIAGSIAVQFSCAQQIGFYQPETIQTIEIFFAQSNWDALLDQQAQTTEDYAIADSVRINGTTFVQVGVKYKGNSSYNANNAKNPLHIELDHVIDQHYQHYTDIKLGNGFSDPSYIREALSYDILKNYMDCPLSNFADVYINGSHIGLYSNDEAINKHFLGTHYYSAESEFVKCNPIGGAGPGGGGGNPDLTWLGADSSLYQTRYELKSDYGWKELVRLIDTLNNNSAALENILDIDRAIWMLAFNNVLVNLDSYSGQFKQNYYLYKDLNGRWVPTVWDLNMSFGGFPGNGLSVSGMQNLNPVFSNDAAHPLIQKLMANARYRKMYIAHLRTITDEFIASGLYLERAAYFRAIIDAAVQNAPNGFYNYTQFQNSLTTNTTGGGGGPGGGSSIPGIQLLMNARNTYLQGTTEFIQQPPVISDVHPIANAFNYGADANILANVSGATNVFLGYRTDHRLRFVRKSMFDDGMHNDGAAGDGIYGAAFLLDGTTPEFYVWAENGVAGAFSPARAEHEFYTVAINSQPLIAGTVVINEVLTSNSIQEDEYGESNDWIELYNASANVIDLGGAHLSDTVGDPLRWTFRAGTLIAPGEYLMVWADDDEEQWFHHTNFNLTSLGETLTLSDATGNPIDQVQYPLQVQDISYGRYPNGVGPWTYMETTFGGTNNTPLSVSNVHSTEASTIAWPNPVKSELFIRSEGSMLHSWRLYDISGQLLMAESTNTLQANIDLSGTSDGVYILTVDLDNGDTSTFRIIKE
jgi:spore coat protein CotH